MVFLNKNLPEADEMESIWELAYNNVSPGCEELFERQCSSVQLRSVTDGAVGERQVATWRPVISCYEKCPMFDPAFGTELDSDLNRFLQTKTAVDVWEHLNEFNNLLQERNFDNQV